MFNVALLEKIWIVRQGSLNLYGSEPRNRISVHVGLQMDCLVIPVSFGVEKESAVEILQEDTAEKGLQLFRDELGLERRIIDQPPGPTLKA